MDMINNRFGLLLANKRIVEKRRISLSEVAKVTGISRQSLQAWENNTVTRFDLPIMDALCDYFGVQPGDLFQYVQGDLKINIKGRREDGVDGVIVSYENYDHSEKTAADTVAMLRRPNEVLFPVAKKNKKKK